MSKQTMSSSVDMKTASSIIVSISTFIGSLSGLEASTLVIGLIFTVLVGITAIRKNLAETELANIKLRQYEHRKGK